MWFRLRTLDDDYLTRAPNTFVMRRELGVSAEKLFAILADETQWTKWFPDMHGVQWMSAEADRRKPHAVRRANTGSGDVMEHFVIWDAPRRMAFYAERMTTPLASEFFEDYAIEPLGEGRSRLVWTVAYQPRLPFRPFISLIRPRFAKMFDDAADALVRYVGA
jgi:hypothetical protein